MLELNNNTHFSADSICFPNENAIDTLYILVRASFKIGSKWTLADEQPPPIQADEFWIEPGKSSIRYASDYHIGKVCSDVIMLGHALAPAGKEATQLNVRLKVGKVHKTVRVFGERSWQDGMITPAKPFKTMAMIYEKSYGGVYIKNSEVAGLESRNPVGRGFSGGRSVKEMNGVPLPNLEDPEDLIRDINHRPMPACFAVSAPHWLPRARYAGTYDDAWQKNRAPYLPEDFDRRFFSMAHPELVYPGYLQGGEVVEISHMHINGNLKFKLPIVKFNTDISINNAIVKPDFNLETLILEPNQLKASLLWRAAVQCDKAMLKISDIKISLLSHKYASDRVDKLARTEALTVG